MSMKTNFQFEMNMVVHVGSEHPLSQSDCFSGQGVFRRKGTAVGRARKMAEAISTSTSVSISSLSGQSR